MQALSRSIKHSAHCSQHEHVSESSPWPWLCKAAVMIMESPGGRSIRSTAELPAHQTSGHGLACLIVCVYIDTAVRRWGCMVGLATWCSLQLVPVWGIIMTCQKCRPLKTGIIHRGYLTKLILTGTKETL